MIQMVQVIRTIQMIQIVYCWIDESAGAEMTQMIENDSDDSDDPRLLSLRWLCLRKLLVFVCFGRINIRRSKPLIVWCQWCLALFVLFFFFFVAVLCYLFFPGGVWGENSLRAGFPRDVHGGKDEGALPRAVEGCGVRATPEATAQAWCQRPTAREQRCRVGWCVGVLVRYFVILLACLFCLLVCWLCLFDHLIVR